MNIIYSTKSPLFDSIVEMYTYESIAKVCGVSIPAVHYWRKRGHLPRSELTGETNYAEKLSVISGIPAKDLRVEALAVISQNKKVA